MCVRWTKVLIFSQCHVNMNFHRMSSIGPLRKTSFLCHLSSFLCHYLLALSFLKEIVFNPEACLDSEQYSLFCCHSWQAMDFFSWSVYPWLQQLRFFHLCCLGSGLTIHSIDRIADAIDEIGVSMFVTTATSTLAFGLGCLSSIPVVRGLHFAIPFQSSATRQGIQ